jgi:C4-dicarboxylate transporter DctM subunit
VVEGAPQKSSISKTKGWPFLFVFLSLQAIGYAIFWADLGRVEIGLAAIGFMLILIFSGAHIAVVLMLLSFLGIGGLGVLRRGQ